MYFPEKYRVMKNKNNLKFLPHPRGVIQPLPLTDKRAQQHTCLRTLTIVIIIPLALAQVEYFSFLLSNY